MNLADKPETTTQEPVASPKSRFSAKRPHIIGVLLFIVVIGIAAGATWSLAQEHSDRILNGVTILQIPVGGLTPEQAQQKVTNSLQTQWKDGLLVSLPSKTFNVGSPFAFLTYDLNNAGQHAKNIGRQGPLVTRLFAPLALYIHNYDVDVPTQIQYPLLEAALRNALGTTLTEPRDADLVINVTSNSSTQVSIASEQTGTAIDTEALAEDIQATIEDQDRSAIPLSTKTQLPSIKSADLEPLIPQAQTWLSHAPFSLRVNKKPVTIELQTLANWISVNTSTTPYSLALNAETLTNDLRLRFPEVLKPVQDGRIEVDAEGKARAFETPAEGVDINASSTIANIIGAWQSSSSTAELALQTIAPAILGDGERLGIREVIGVGRSSFGGSPSNRRKNIALGAKMVNMTLIPPGEEFSMITSLGEIDGEHGWLAELVIKGNKTTPEFGGGLCQVGTTMFRAALAAGMPITERQNHSYRVSYYEPAGTDATIYDPKPDFRFKNDTAGWLLITTEVKGDDMAFTVWGTKDGRLVEQTYPRIYNIVSPPPKKIIETLDLPVGKEKCTESAHAGADAEFDYTVTYANGTSTKRTFKSHYKPWQAVCLRGVAELTQPPVEGVDETGINNPNL